MLWRILIINYFTHNVETMNFRNDRTKTNQTVSKQTEFEPELISNRTRIRTKFEFVQVLIRIQIQV